MANTTYTEDLTEVKRVADTLKNNKVAKFAYTEEAYAQDKADGVSAYDFNRANNIPVGTPEILNVNDTILTKGYRARSSSITRMLLNHFFGRTSYNLNKISDTVRNLIDTLKNNLGAPNGYASLDENGRIPSSQLPESAIEYKGNWNAETNEPPLSDGMKGATSGDFYIVSVAGSHDFGNGEITFLVNDRIIYSKENKWEKLAGGNVRSVNRKEPDNATGNITLYGTDIPTSETERINITEKIKQYAVAPLLGRNWTQSNKTDDSFAGGARYANGVWVACSSGNNGLWYSIDGRDWTWTNNKYGDFKGGARYANGVWVACSSSQGLWYSADGKNWTRSNKTDGSFAGGARYANGVWVACSGGVGIGLWYSTDGRNWTQSNKTDSGFAGGARYANGVWVACSIGQGLWYSADGRNWTQSNNTEGDFKGGARYANGVWVACSGNYALSEGAGLWYSADGKNWTQSNKTDGSFAGGARYANGVWVACSSSQGLWYSIDGRDWTQSNMTDGGFKGGARYANGVWVACSGGVGIGLWYSTDGRNWTQSNHPAKFFDGGARYANGVWVACSDSIQATVTAAGLWYSDVKTFIDNGWFK